MRAVKEILARALERLSLVEHRRLWAALAAALLISLVLAGFGFGALVRARVAKEAARRGIEVEVERVRLGWGGIWLQGVRASIPKMPAVRVELAAVRVQLGIFGGGREIQVHGGSVKLDGTSQDVAAQFRAFRGKESRTVTESGTRTQYAAYGISVLWTNAASGVRPQQAWGLSFVRAADGSEQISSDLLRASLDGTHVQVRGLAARLARSGRRRVIQSLKVSDLNAEVEFAAPKQVPTPRAVTTPARLARKKIVRPPFQPDLLRGPRLRALVHSGTRMLAEVLPAGGAIDLSGMRLKVKRGVDVLNVGPSRLHVSRGEKIIDVALKPGDKVAESTPLELRALLPLAEGEVRLEVNGGPVSLASLGVREHDFGLIGVNQATLEARGQVSLSADGQAASFSGTGKLDRLALQRKELASGVLSGIRAQFRVSGDARLDGSLINVSEAEIALGDVRMQGRGSYERAPDFTSMDLRGTVPLAACQAMLEAVPKAMIPLVASVKLTGTFALDGSVVFDSRKPEAARVRLDVANDCRVSEIPAAIDPARFRNAWGREVSGPGASTFHVESGPGSLDWVPYEDISPFMETAIIVCEDAGFLRHRGFDYRAIESSIRDNLRAGRFMRGASTASMQLAKNLYLRKEKTLGRKLQEAVLTMLLEQELTKQELLELYLNVIEYGPGIYGIGPAARHYFNKPARELSLAQALYLASILPSPDRQHFEPDGRIKDGWMSYLVKLMHIAHKIHRITDEELERGLTETVAFGVADSSSEPMPAGSELLSPQEVEDSPPEL